MTTPWTISAAADRVEPNAQGQAEVTFTVTNSGLVDQRLVLDVVPGENADRAWFTVVEPQRLVPHGGSVSFLIRIAVPAGTPPGSYWLAGRAYSADAAPEETSALSDRVSFGVGPSAAPPEPTHRLWLIPVAVLVVAVLGVVLFLVLRNDDESAPPSAATSPTEPPEKSAAEQTLTEHSSGQLAIRGGSGVDLDELVVGGTGAGNDIFVQDWLDQATDSSVQALNGATMAKIGPTAGAMQACAAAELSDALIEVWSLAADDVLCVRTNRGRLSVVTVDHGVAPNLGATLNVHVTTFEQPGAGQ